jgi:GntR family transcriptional regulator/MocR family aminotransferase
MTSLTIPLYQRLYEDVKEKILAGELKKNQKLESIRSLSARLDLSTTTVEKAYNQLVVEGYIKSVPRSGYVVMDVENLGKRPTRTYVEPIDHPIKENNKLTMDLFDIKSYKSTVNKVFNYQADRLFTDLDPRGEEDLREEIRKYILTERDVKCDVNQIIVGPGIQPLLTILLSLYPKKTVTYLTPAFPKAMQVFRSFDYALKPRRTTTEIARIKADYLFLSPSNLYPTGEVLKAQERNKLIKWAHKNDSYIIEDDYNFFLRYNAYTVPSIHSYDHGERVIYIGSFSKSIIPSIRVSYMVLPIPLYERYRERYTEFAQGVSKLEQLSLALFMKEGLYKRHTKKLYNLYKEKNDKMKLALDQVNRHKNFTVRGTDSNLHVVLDFRTPTLQKTFIKNCERSHLQYERIPDSNSVIFPYSGIENNDIPKLVRNLFYNM